MGASYFNRCLGQTMCAYTFSFSELIPGGSRCLSISDKSPVCFQRINRSFLHDQCWNEETPAQCSPHARFWTALCNTPCWKPQREIYYSLGCFGRWKGKQPSKDPPQESGTLFVKADTESRLLCSSVKPDQPPGTVNYVQHSSSAKTCTEVIMLQDQRRCNEQQKRLHSKQRAVPKKAWYYYARK